jgi:Domain of unknown function (DUF4406)
MTMNVYISGPMTGIPDFNFAAFYDAEEFLRMAYGDSLGLVFNPARRDEEKYGPLPSETGSPKDVPQFNLREAFAEDMRFICEDATHILMLPGWTKSKGATAELHVARVLGIEVMGAWA